MIVTTWFLSMWMVNVAAVAMMLTILEPILEEMEKLRKEDTFESNQPPDSKSGK